MPHACTATVIPPGSGQPGWRRGWTHAAGLAGVVILSLMFVACGQSEVDRVAVDLVTRGTAIYAQQCVSCHGDRRGQGATPGTPSHGPDGHTWHHPDGQLRSIILDGGAFAMPAFRGRLEAGDIDAVLAYIKTWWTEDQRRTQARLSADAP